MGEVLALANCHVNMKFALVVIYPHDFRKKKNNYVSSFRLFAL